MDDTIIRLKEIFLENQVRNVADLRGLSPKGFNKLDASGYAWFSSFRTEMVRQLIESDGLNMCLGLKRNTEDVAIGAPMETNEHIKEVGKFLVGGSLFPSALKYFQLNADKKAVIDKTPFYFPWLLHREAKKLAPK